MTKKNMLAIDGGAKTLPTPLPAWPKFDRRTDRRVLEILHSGRVNYWTGSIGHEFETAFAQWLGCKYAISVTNGTAALHVALAALGIGSGDEVICTPYSFIASSFCALQAGAMPVFCYVGEDHILDAAKLEALITPRTKAIVPVHVYGNVCDVAGFDRLGEKYGVKIIYDAAHAFGIRDGESPRSIATRGDMSMFSFHPTKLFHSCEGGCLVFKDAALQDKLFNLRNFAIVSETECVDVGSNAKMNELQALMGLCCLKKINDLLAWRKAISDAYAAAFAGSPVRYLGGASGNHAYCPVLFKDEATREKVYDELKAKCNVFSRRYFYPTLTEFAPYIYGKGSCPVAEDASRRVLTLPTYYGLEPSAATEIAKCVLEIARA